jgi:CRP-like cAMP-binding protein
MALRAHDVPARELLFRADGNPQRLYFVAKGWIRGATALSISLRPISTLSIRGDVIGLSWMDRPNRMEDVSTITACELISVPTQDFRDWMQKDATLRNFVFNEIIREMMNIRMMSAVVGHMKAPDRLAYFLFIMLERCRRTYQTQLRTLSLPMTQEEIGRLLGLTNVSVNRAFRALETEGVIQTGRQSVTILDEDAFANRFDMTDRPELMDQLVGSRRLVTEAA